MRDTPIDINVSSVFNASGIVGNRSDYKYTMMQSILHTMNPMDTSALTMMHALLFSPFEEVLREAHLRVDRDHYQSHQEWQDAIESFILEINRKMVELFHLELDLMRDYRVDLLSLVLAERERASKEECKEMETEIEDRQQISITYARGMLSPCSSMLRAPAPNNADTRSDAQTPKWVPITPDGWLTRWYRSAAPNALVYAATEIKPFISRSWFFMITTQNVHIEVTSP
ncbi:uncharacterized protein EV422DRAFT_543437 [Fimicolochytrium jonesii]|uniref:uncharacterized protein n=1 Tax=Fimicolochytrium jonesii TaxID=1396493 RepID=UPI0022FE0E00|nr:uncharacterized protein EV422DRAFT_543437 [Fimicolochytrium jonesii]KAI8816898.1 hypothetical protein EV422DRAFT_543437 [Fimicolochytrium jonesii]